MINFVTLVGKIRHKGNTGISLEVNRVDSDLNADNLFIPCIYWTRERLNYLTSLNEGTLVAIRGRIDYSEKAGFHIIVEQLTIIANNK